MGEIEELNSLKPEVSIVEDNSFKGKYTTAELVTADTSTEKKEEKKTVLSNDFYMLGQYLECIINRMVR